MRHWCNETLIERYDAWLTKDSLDVLWSTVVSIFIIGGVIGSVGGAWIADRFGRLVSIVDSINYCNLY